MQEAVLMKNLPKALEPHKSQWDKIHSGNTDVAKIVDSVGKPSGKAMIFSHDDPDGITSGLIFKRMLIKKGWKAELYMPPGFLLQPSQFEEALKAHPDTKAIFILDKGTLAPYTEFGKRLPVTIVDHHPTPSAPTGCVVFNPSLEKYTPCSTSLLAHGISTLAGTRDPFDDFLCLVGLKGDWAIEPVKGILVDMAKPFFLEYGVRFKNLMTMVQERPTMFDAEQREGTCLLSRISEFVHGTGGGGFQYFYNDRDPSLKEVDHPQCIAKALEEISGKAEALPSLSSLDGFIEMLPSREKDLLQKIWGFFLKDWESADRLLDSSLRLMTLEETGIYLFVGGKVPLLPMIGSIKLFGLKEAFGDKTGQIIMVSAVSRDYTHVSVRGTGDRVHSGKICGLMERTLQANFPELKDKISGGGHPRAAECTVKTDRLPFHKVLSQLLSHLGEMSEADAAAKKGKLPPDRQKRALELGLEYLSQ